VSSKIVRSMITRKIMKYCLKMLKLSTLRFNDTQGFYL